MIAKCGVLVKDHHAEVHEREIGEVGPNQVLIKMLACNLCTTDYQQWMGHREKQGYPMAGGHEGAGIIEKVGSAVSDYGLRTQSLMWMNWQTASIWKDGMRRRDTASAWTERRFARHTEKSVNDF